MAKIIAIVNQKGGVGKTTTTVNLTAALAALGKRVLLCDFDPQANATSGMGVDKNTASPNVYDVLINGADPRRGVVTTHYGDVLPSNKALAGAGVEMIALPDREHLLRKALEVLSPGYDFIFVDCPPSLELLTVNALCAADSLLVPFFRPGSEKRRRTAQGRPAAKGEVQTEGESRDRVCLQVIWLRQAMGREGEIGKENVSRETFLPNGLGNTDGEQDLSILILAVTAGIHPGGPH